MGNGDSADLIDFSQIDALLCAAGREGVSAILQAFWRSTDNLASELERRIGDCDFSEAAKAAHALKGSAANVGANRLASAARAVEIACKAGDGAAAKSALAEIRQTVGDTRRVMTERLDAAA